MTSLYGGAHPSFRHASYLKCDGFDIKSFADLSYSYNERHQEQWEYIGYPPYESQDPFYNPQGQGFIFNARPLAAYGTYRQASFANMPSFQSALSEGYPSHWVKRGAKFSSNKMLGALIMEMTSVDDPLHLLQPWTDDQIAGCTLTLAKNIVSKDLEVCLLGFAFHIV